MPPPSLLVTATGADRPGIAAALCGALAAVGARVLDVEQVTVHGRLLLCVEVEGGGDLEGRLSAALEAAAPGPLAGVDLAVLAPGGPAAPEGAHEGGRLVVTVLAPELGPAALGPLFGRVAATGANIERIVQLARYPVTSYELTVAAPDAPALRAGLAAEAARVGVDLSVQAAGLHRRARHLIVLDVDSTLLQGEVIDRLAARTGHAEEVTAVTAQAMAGELDFAEALRRRVALLAGLPAGVLHEVAGELRPTPGARTLVRTAGSGT